MSTAHTLTQPAAEQPAFDARWSAAWGAPPALHAHSRAREQQPEAPEHDAEIPSVIDRRTRAAPPLALPAPRDTARTNTHTNTHTNTQMRPQDGVTLSDDSDYPYAYWQADNRGDTSFRLRPMRDDDRERFVEPTEWKYSAALSSSRAPPQRIREPDTYAWQASETDSMHVRQHLGDGRHGNVGAHTRADSLHSAASMPRPGQRSASARSRPIGDSRPYSRIDATTHDYRTPRPSQQPDERTSRYADSRGDGDSRDRAVPGAQPGQQRDERPAQYFTDGDYSRAPQPRPGNHSLGYAPQPGEHFNGPDRYSAQRYEASDRFAEQPGQRHMRDPVLHRFDAPMHTRACVRDEATGPRGSSSIRNAPRTSHAEALAGPPHLHRYTSEDHYHTKPAAGRAAARYGRH
jgi:hypothetical protein